MKSSKKIKVYYKIRELINSKNLLMRISKINIYNLIIKIFNDKMLKMLEINQCQKKNKTFLLKNKIR